MIEAGTHVARVIDVELGESRNGKEQLVLKFQIIDENDPDYGETINAYRYFTGGAAEWTIKDMRTCGWTGYDMFSLTADDFPNDVEIVVENEEYNGKVYTKVRWINPIGGRPGIQGVTPLDDQRRRAFADRMKALAMKVGPAGAPATAPGGAPAGQPAQAAPQQQPPAQRYQQPQRPAPQRPAPRRPAPQRQSPQRQPAMPTAPEPYVDDDQIPF